MKNSTLLDCQSSFNLDASLKSRLPVAASSPHFCANSLSLNLDREGELVNRESEVRPQQKFSSDPIEKYLYIGMENSIQEKELKNG